MDNYVFMIIEILGTISFTVSGVIAGMRRKLDLFGVVFLGLITAVGGGLLRDIILNQDIPAVFRNPMHAGISVLIALIFLVPSIRKIITKKRHIYDLTLLIMDSLGLGIFTVVGVRASMLAVPNGGIYMHIFLGVVTGVGGGVLRDVLSNSKPYIFTKHIYALASIAGAALCSLLWNVAGSIVSMISGALLIFVLRCLAAHFQWNLPHPTEDSDDGSADKGDQHSVYEPSLTDRTEK